LVVGNYFWEQIKNWAARIESTTLQFWQQGFFDYLNYGFKMGMMILVFWLLSAVVKPASLFLLKKVIFISPAKNQLPAVTSHRCNHMFLQADFNGVFGLL